MDRVLGGFLVSLAIVVVATTFVFLGAFGVVQATDGPLAYITYNERGIEKCRFIEYEDGHFDNHCPADWRKYMQKEVGPRWQPPKEKMGRPL